MGEVKYLITQALAIQEVPAIAQRKLHRPLRRSGVWALEVGGCQGSECCESFEVAS